MLDGLAARGIERTAITLHVGYGTFKPVRVERVEDHVVDPEPYEISDRRRPRSNAARQDGRRVIAVGTTTTRALEDAAIRGGGDCRRRWRRSRPSFIYPGFEFKVIDGLITNFHLPRSSLPDAGRRLRRPRAACSRPTRARCAERYRFYSYGDAMLIV